MLIDQPYISNGEKIGYLMKLDPVNGKWSGKFMPLLVYNELIAKSKEQIVIPEPVEKINGKRRGRPRA